MASGHQSLPVDRNNRRIRFSSVVEGGLGAAVARLFQPGYGVPDEVVFTAIQSGTLPPVSLRLERAIHR